MLFQIVPRGFLPETLQMLELEFLILPLWGYKKYLHQKIIKYISWNIRGMGKNFKLNIMKKIIKEYKLEVICLLETKIREDEFPKFLSK